MLDPRKFVTLLAVALVALLPTVASAQVFSDGEFLAGGYTSSTPLSSADGGWPGPPAQSDIRYNIDYSNIDIFNDGFIVASIPEAPRSDPNDSATTGLFLSANNDSQSAGSGVWSYAAAIPNGLNVGNGTATPNFKMTVDVFHSAGTGVRDPNGVLGGLSGTTNYSLLSINQTNTTVQVEDLNAPGGGTNLSGQGLGLMYTADGGAAEDLAPLYAGAFYRDRLGGSSPGFSYRGTPDPNGTAIGFGKSGLASWHLNEYWMSQGLGYEIDDGGIPGFDPNNQFRLTRFTGDSLAFSPDPNKAGVYDINNLNDPNDPNFPTFRRIYGEAITETTGVPGYLSGSFIQNTDPNLSDVGDNSVIPDGILSNAWATHELYWVDGVFSYVIDGVPVLEIDPEYDPNDISSGNVYDPFSESGSVVLGFFDRFNSVASSPEGANFVIYDNLEIEAVSSGAAPDLLDFYEGLGFLLPSAGIPGDFDGNGRVDADDFLAWQRNPALGDLADWEANYGLPLSASAEAVPEPFSATMLLVGTCSLAMLRRRR